MIKAFSGWLAGEIEWCWVNGDDAKNVLVFTALMTTQENCANVY